MISLPGFTETETREREGEREMIFMLGILSYELLVRDAPKTI